MPSLAAGVQQQASLGKRTSSPTGGLKKRHKQARRAGHRGHKKPEDTEEIITLMARIVIQHEDQLGLSRMDRAFTLFMEQTGLAGVFSNLYQAGVEWNQKREERGMGSKLQPLRTTLLTLMVMELVARLEKLQASKDDRIKCRQQGWLNEEDLMLFQAWDPEKKRLTASTDLEPMTIEAVLKTLRGIIPLISPDHVLKFHAQRPLKGMSEAENKAVFNLEISLRAPAAHQLYGHVMRLAGSLCWQIIGAQVRRDAQRRSGASGTTTPGVRDTRRPESALNAVQQQLLKQRLINSSNTCYVNACIMAILWQVADTAWPSLPEAWKRHIERFQ